MTQAVAGARVQEVRAEQHVRGEGGGAAHGQRAGQGGQRPEGRGLRRDLLRSGQPRRKGPGCPRKDQSDKNVALRESTAISAVLP